MTVKCPKCQADNPEDTFFCGKCATPLPAAPGKISEDKLGIHETGHDLAAGTLVAAKYRILAKLGAGGMGEVYRAEDLNLNREVALKVLPDVFATDPERLARFQREARVLASLNHPNIAAIHDVEEAAGKRFLVLELVEGETLAERLTMGPLSLEETLDVCGQVAEGLEGAHEKGIIHRDLKPSNVKITSDGKVKILDFGLARAFHDQVSEADIIKSPTITADMTRPGVVLGTAAYMSPEQAKGKTVDRRADIWAFGCILYECLTGKRAFGGETITETLAAILKGEPDWNELPSDTPPSIRRLLNRCLARDRGSRLSDIHDAGIEIRDSSLEHAPAPGARISDRRFSRQSVLWMIALSVGLTVLGTLIVRSIVGQKIPQPVPAVVRFTIPGAFTATRPSVPALALSSDGRRLVTLAERGDKSQLFLRTLDRLEASPLDGTENGGGVFFSPDGQQIAFFAAGKLKKLAVTGGAPTDICEAVGGLCGSWGVDDVIVFSPRWGSGLYRVPAAGGAPSGLTTLNAAEREVSHLWPQILPGGNAVLFTVAPGDTLSMDDCLIAVQVMGQKEHRILVRGGSYGRYAASGHLVYIRKGALLALPFDLKTLQVKGTPTMVLDNIQSTDWTGVAHFALSESGTFFYASGGVHAPDRSLVLVDLRGNVRPIVPDRRVFEPAFSSDGRIAMRIAAANDDIWVYAPERQQLARITFDLGDELYPVWTPDRKKIVYSGGRTNLLWKAADGSGEPEQLLVGDYIAIPGSISPDGSVLAFTQANPKSGQDIWLLPLKGNRKPQDFITTSFNETSPRFSPNGRWVAYASDESGRGEIYLKSVQETGGKKLVSTAGGNFPVWSHAGDRLFFLNGNRMMAAKVDPESGTPGSVEFLFELPSLYPMHFDIGPDDKSFAMVVRNVQPPETELRVILNWFEELKRLVPTGKK